MKDFHIFFTILSQALGSFASLACNPGEGTCTVRQVECVLISSTVSSMISMFNVQQHSVKVYLKIIHLVFDLYFNQC